MGVTGSTYKTVSVYDIFLEHPMKGKKLMHIKLSANTFVKMAT